MLQVVVLLCLLHSTSYGAIGKITEDKGSANIERQKSKLDAQNGLGIESMDRVETANGIIGITFQDNTQVRVTEHSKLLIDDFVYDPNKKGAGKLALNVTMGTVRYASGNIAHENNKNVAINTPTATVAVRGTAFTMTVDEVGKSLIILLPNADGSVGMIDVITATGTVTLNQAFQATMTSSPEVKPTKPVLLLLSESAIDNMLIVKPPREILKQIIEEVKDRSGAALDFNGLDQNALDAKVWKDPYANYDELSINALDGEYLGNAFDNQLLTAFQVGYNSLTGTYIFDKQTFWQVSRPKGNQNATILINKDKGYTINFNQNGSQTSLSSQDSTTNTININQKGN
jgi:hypothetical protein